MSLTIELSPLQEQIIRETAAREGVSVAEITVRALQEQFPHPNQAALELFAQWEREDALASEAERAEDARIYAEIEKNGIPRVRI